MHRIAVTGIEAQDKPSRTLEHAPVECREQAGRTRTRVEEDVGAPVAGAARDVGDGNIVKIGKAKGAPVHGPEPERVTIPSRRRADDRCTEESGRHRDLSRHAHGQAQQRAAAKPDVDGRISQSVIDGFQRLHTGAERARTQLERLPGLPVAGAIDVSVGGADPGFDRVSDAHPEDPGRRFLRTHAMPAISDEEKRAALGGDHRGDRIAGWCHGDVLHAQIGQPLRRVPDGPLPIDAAHDAFAFCGHPELVPVIDRAGGHHGVPPDAVAGKDEALELSIVADDEDTAPAADDHAGRSVRARLEHGGEERRGARGEVMVFRPLPVALHADAARAGVIALVRRGVENEADDPVGG